MRLRLTEPQFERCSVILQFVGVEGLMTAIFDTFPFLKKGHRREIFTGVMCIIQFLVGLLMVTNVGLCLFSGVFSPLSHVSVLCYGRFLTVCVDNCSFVLVFQGGMYIFQLFDYYSGSRIILLVAFFMCIAIGYIYGKDSTPTC